MRYVYIFHRLKCPTQSRHRVRSNRVNLRLVIESLCKTRVPPSAIVSRIIHEICIYAFVGALYMDTEVLRTTRLWLIADEERAAAVGWAGGRFGGSTGGIGLQQSSCRFDRYWWRYNRRRDLLILSIRNSYTRCKVRYQNHLQL